MKRYISALFILFSLSTNAQDITTFDYPLLLGDWYWFNQEENSEEKTNSYKAISIHFNSDYQFNVRLLGNSGMVETASGIYDLDENTMIFYDQNDSAQHHKYHLNHNQLILKGALFTKILPQKLSGEWFSDVISGDDVDEDIAKFALLLRPDFLFSAEVSSKEGKSITHRGIYYLEDDHLVLVYKNGQHESKFQLDADTLILSNKQFGMEAVLKRQ